MSDLKSKLQTDSQEALKAGDQAKRLTLSMLITAIKNKEVEKKTAGQNEELTDEEVITVISSEAKKRKDSIKAYEDGEREDLAQKEREELKILEEYLPEQMHEDDVRKIVQETITETGAESMQDMGKLMGAVMAKVKGKTDGNVVSKLAKEELSK